MTENGLYFCVKHQMIQRCDQFFVVANSRNYLQATFVFATEDWKDVPKTAIFQAPGGEAKQVLLENDACRVPYEVLEKPGVLRVSVFGGDRITVDSASVLIHESGYTQGTEPGEPTPDVYAQLVALAEETKGIADSVRQDADSGLFNGKDGAPGPQGEPGPAGADGKNGADGATWLPSVDESGLLTWTKNSEAEPASANIRGPQGIPGTPGKDGEPGKNGENGAPGKDGQNGQDGKSAYAYAQEGGYVGEEAQFYQDLAAVAGLGTILDEINGEVV